MGGRGNRQNALYKGPYRGNFAISHGLWRPISSDASPNTLKPLDMVYHSDLLVLILIFVSCTLRLNDSLSLAVRRDLCCVHWDIRPGLTGLCLPAPLHYF